MAKIRIRDPEWQKFGSGIRNGKNSDPGSGMKKIRIRDKHPGSAIILVPWPRVMGKVLRPGEQGQPAQRHLGRVANKKPTQKTPIKIPTKKPTQKKTT